MRQNSRKKLRQKQRHPPPLKREQQQKHKLWEQHPQELPANKHAAILEKMDVNVAAQVTEKMRIN